MNFKLPHKQSKPKPCPRCKEVFTPTKPLQKYCNPACQFKFKAGEVKEDELHLLDRSVLEEMATALCHEYIKLRDKDKPCISCGQPYSKSNPMQAGHYYKSELYAGVRYDEVNINGECRNCNYYDQNHLINYTSGLHNRYRSSDIEELHLKANLTRFHKYSIPELIEIIIKYKNKLEK